jgi:hypothetical protein
MGEPQDQVWEALLYCTELCRTVLCSSCSSDIYELFRFGLFQTDQNCTRLGLGTLEKFPACFVSVCFIFTLFLLNRCSYPE